MTQISTVETLLKDSFKIINGLPHYIAIEEKENVHYDHENCKDEISILIDFAAQSELNRVGALINRTSEHYLHLSKILINLGFEKYASKVEVFRDLQDINNNIKGFEWRSLSDSTISEDEFKKI